MPTVTQDMVIADIIALNEGVIPILINAGMHCVGCPSAQGETLEEACSVHNMQVDRLVEEINAFLSK